VLASTLSGCSLFPGKPAIDDAAKFVPADATALVFTDRQAIADRLGVGDISGRDATAEDVQRYDKAFTDQPWSGTQLQSFLPAMRVGPFNELDVRWEVATRWDDRSAVIWRADDKLDLGALGRSLTDNGYRKDTVDGLARYEIDFAARSDPSTGLVGGLYPAAMTDVLIDSEDHLVVGAQSPDALAGIAAVAAGDADALADHPGDYDELLDKADKAEFAAMAAGDGICQAVTPYGRKSPAPPTPEYAALGHPVARGLVGTGDPMATVTYLEFAGDGDASADAEARTTLLAHGKELRTEQPFRQLGDFSVSHSGDLVTVTAQWASGPQAAVSAELTGGGPAACLPQK
jgi:hypothetical protein